MGRKNNRNLKQKIKKNVWNNFGNDSKNQGKKKKAKEFGVVKAARMKRKRDFLRQKICKVKTIKK